MYRLEIVLSLPSKVAVKRVAVKRVVESETPMGFQPRPLAQVLPLKSKRSVNS